MSLQMKEYTIDCAKKSGQDFRQWKKLPVKQRPQSNTSTQSFTKVSAHLGQYTNVGLRIRPATAGNLVRVTPPEGMQIAGHFIQGNVCLV